MPALFISCETPAEPRETAAARASKVGGPLFLACGTGTSKVARGMAEAIAERRGLVLVPSRALLADDLKSHS